jgi:hypothetical protein
VRKSSSFTKETLSGIGCQCLQGVDSVEKVRDTPAARNNRIIGGNPLNRTCAFDAFLESILLTDPH